MPQSTVNIKLTPDLINELKPLILGPYPSFFLSGIYVIIFLFKDMKYLDNRAVEDAPSTS